jgi:crossover junction endodeoxyribonuclease RuvC
MPKCDDGPISVILGIDPGISGAIAAVQGEALLWAHDLPIVSETVRGKLKRHIDPVALALAVKLAKPELVICERVSASPGMGVSSAFSFGETFGLICAAVHLAAPSVKFQLVTPQAWKTAMRCPADKALARERATAEFGTAEHWPLKRDHGRAEAALIAKFGALTA